MDKEQWFRCTYEVDDGYVGNRPQHFSISADDLCDDMTEVEISDLFDSEMQSDFEQCISPYPKNKEKFIEWAKDKISRMVD